MKMKEFMSLKSDLIFRELMRDEIVRKHFISDALGIPLEEIRSVRLEDTFLRRFNKRLKQGILDVRVLLNDNRKINVELQIEKLTYWDKRNLYYLSSMYTENLYAGEKYSKLKKCTMISILDFKGDTNPGYHKVYQLRDEQGRLYSDLFEIHIIELNQELTGDRMDDWIRLFNANSREELEMIQSANPGVMRAIEGIKTMNLGRRLRMLYRERLMIKADQDARIEAARMDGEEVGREEGETLGDLKRSRQNILDLLEDLGEIPEDIYNCIGAEEDIEVLRKWHKAAARTESYDAFREILKL